MEPAFEHEPLDADMPLRADGGTRTALGSHAEAAQAPPKAYSDAYNAILCGGESSTGCYRVEVARVPRGSGRTALVQVLRHQNDRPHSVEFYRPALSYLRTLRNTANTCPTCASPLRDHYDGAPQTLWRHLKEQTNYIYSTLPVRHGIPVFENEHGIAMGMEQIEFAAYLASLAQTFAASEPSQSKQWLRRSIALSKSLHRRAAPFSGGIAGPDGVCAVKRARARRCTLYSARGTIVPNVTQPHYVLNQNMHVLRDTLSLIDTLARNEGTFRGWISYEAEQAALLDALIAGLYQLAFPQHDGPLPAARDYMNRRVIGVSEGQNPLPYYWAHYEFLEGTGMRGISHERTCHYHFHALDVFGHIVTASQRASVRDVLASHPDGWRVHEAINALTQGAGEATGAAGSDNALYQFFRSTSPTFAERRQHCDHASSISQKSRDALASRFN